MISSLHNLFWPVSNPKAAKVAPPAPKRAASAKASSVPSFGSMVKPAVKAAPAAPAIGAKSGEAPPVRLGPMTADPNTHPAAPPPRQPDPITSSPYMPPGFRGTVNLMNRDEHVQTMNAWLQNYTRWSNDNKTQIYQQALYNWELNNQRCQELGIDPPPKPAPPALDPIENLPAAYWFA